MRLSGTFGCILLAFAICEHRAVARQQDLPCSDPLIARLSTWNPGDLQPGLRALIKTLERTPELRRFRKRHGRRASVVVSGTVDYSQLRVFRAMLGEALRTPALMSELRKKLPASVARLDKATRDHAANRASDDDVFLAFLKDGRLLLHVRERMKGTPSSRALDLFNDFPRGIPALVRQELSRSKAIQVSTFFDSRPACPDPEPPVDYYLRITLFRQDDLRPTSLAGTRVVFLSLYDWPTQRRIWIGDTRLTRSWQQTTADSKDPTCRIVVRAPGVGSPGPISDSTLRRAAREVAVGLSRKLRAVGRKTSDTRIGIQLSHQVSDEGDYFQMLAAAALIGSGCQVNDALSTAELFHTLKSDTCCLDSDTCHHLPPEAKEIATTIFVSGTLTPGSSAPVSGPASAPALPFTLTLEARDAESNDQIWKTVRVLR